MGERYHGTSFHLGLPTVFLQQPGYYGLYVLQRFGGQGKSVEGVHEQALYPSGPLHPADLQQEQSFLLCEMGSPSYLGGLIISTT